VPAVVDLTAAQAERRLAGAGFDAVVSRRASEEPRGRVVAQDPPGGSRLPTDRAVLVVVSGGPARVAVPDLVGLRLGQARERLAALRLRTVPVAVFAEAPRRTVVATDPVARMRVPRGSAVRVSYSRGSGLVDVPSLLGREREEARRLVARAGLVPAPFDVASAEAAGTVVRQSPQPGDRAAAGARVRIDVSTGEGRPGARAGRVTVPDVVGRQLTAVQDSLGALGLVVRVAYDDAAGPEGRIAAQAPAAGTPVRPGASVRVTVSAGPDARSELQVIDVLGLDPESAAGALQTAAFRSRVLPEPTPDPAEHGVVVRQEPAAGEPAPQNALITLYVGRKP
jgi:serine/threonine-protein kinase